MVVIMILAFLICWSPYAAFSILVTACPSIELDARLAAIPAFFSKTATVYNPIIYVFMNNQVVYSLLLRVFKLDHFCLRLSHFNYLFSVRLGPCN